MDGQWRTWRLAMQQALYGEGGFYLRAGAPGRHFRTAAHTSPAWAAAMTELARRVDVRLGKPSGFTIVEVGAGGGELITAMADAAPARWALQAVELAPAPPGLPRRVGWGAQLPERFCGLLLAVEWLDVVPVDVVERTPGGVQLVEVAPDGSERLGGAATPTDRRWLDRWWPLAAVGDRAEVGTGRDAAWADAAARLTEGLAVAVDYAAVPERDVAGTLTGYRDGRQVLPVPDGHTDITAHVQMESVAAASVGSTLLLRQRDALRRLGVTADRPEYDGDPHDYLRKLAAVGAAAELLDPGGLGGFTWLLQAKGLDVDTVMADCPP